MENIFPKIKKAADGCNAILQPELLKHPKDGGAIPICSRLALTQADTRQTTLWRPGDHQLIPAGALFPRETTSPTLGVPQPEVNE